MMKRQSFSLISLDDTGCVGMDKFDVRLADSKQIFVFDNYLPMNTVVDEAKKRAETDSRFQPSHIQFVITTDLYIKNT